MNDHENWSKGADDGVRSAALDALDFLRCREDFWEQVCTVGRAKIFGATRHDDF